MPWSWRRFWIHFPIGLLMGIANIPLALGIIILFTAYELNEDGHLKDHAYIDIQGALGGVLVAVVLRWLLAWVGIDMVKLSP